MHLLNYDGYYKGRVTPGYCDESKFKGKTSEELLVKFLTNPIQFEV